MTFQPEESLRAEDRAIQNPEGNRLFEQALQSPQDWSKASGGAGRESQARAAELISQGVLPDVHLTGSEKGAQPAQQRPDAAEVVKYAEKKDGTSEPVEKFQNSAVNRDQVTTRPDGTREIVRADGTKRVEYPEGNWYEQRKDGSHVWGKKDGSTRTEFPDGSWTRKDVNPKTGDVTVSSKSTNGDLTTKYPDGRSETIKSDGTRITESGNTRQTEYPSHHPEHAKNGIARVTQRPGETIIEKTDGSKTTEWPNGLKQIVTPDGKSSWQIPQSKMRIKS